MKYVISPLKVDQTPVAQKLLKLIQHQWLKDCQKMSQKSFGRPLKVDQTPEVGTSVSNNPLFPPVGLSHFFFFFRFDLFLDTN